MYPLANGDTTRAAVLTGEERPPKRGEWYIDRNGRAYLTSSTNSTWPKKIAKLVDNR